MPITNIPPSSSLQDGQYLQIEGPDSILTGYQYSLELKSLFFKESQVIYPSFHGRTHIAEDPVPQATCDTQGLMSPDDKCKLDQLVQTRLGVLGWMGAGYAEDGGWMSGDLILAAGSEFISIERIGNVIRWTVDAPVPFSCVCFQAGVRILLHDGTTKAIEDIAVGDLVVTHLGRCRRVVKLFRTQHDGPMYRWKADKHSGESFIITGNHPVMALERSKAYSASGKVRGKVREAPTWTKARDISAGDLIVRRRSHNLCSDIQIIDTLAALGSDNFIERNGLIYPVRCDGSVDGMANGIPRFLPVDNDLLDLIGYYAAKGCSDRRNGVRFSVHVGEMAFGDIGAEIRRIVPIVFGIDPVVNNRGTPNGKDIQFFSAAAVELFKKWFGKKLDKRFPEWVTLLPAEKQARVVAAVIRGDGYLAHAQNGTTYFSLGMAARSLIDQALFMAERCCWEPANQEPIANNGRVRYRMTISASNAPELCDLLGVERQFKKLHRERRYGEHVMHRLAEWSETYYTGTVFNFEVEEDNSYVVDGLVAHNCEECLQIFWVQDESDVSAIRPPTCGGKLPGSNVYGELKVYLFPDSTVVDPANTKSALRNKGNYPSLIFKRYGNSIAPGFGEFDLVLARSRSNSLQAEIGWSFTPGPALADGTPGRPECLWALGLDNDGNLVTMELGSESEPGLLGALLYKGHQITKQMAVIVDYTATVLSSNQYLLRMWSVLDAAPVGDPFVATNIWRYNNPTGPSSGPGARSLSLDVNQDILPLGSLVDLWSFKIGEISGTPIRRFFFNKQPALSPTSLWGLLGAVEFGDIDQARAETSPTVGTTGTTGEHAALYQIAYNDFESGIWGLTGYNTPVALMGDISAMGTSAAPDVLTEQRAIIDPVLPGLRITFGVGTQPYIERPVMLWNRITTPNSVLARLEIGRPQIGGFPPYDVLLVAPIDSRHDLFCKVVGTGTVNGLNYIKVSGISIQQLPRTGTIRISHSLINPQQHSRIWKYREKAIVPDVSDEGVYLLAGADRNLPYGGAPGDVVEILHEEYSATCVRVQFSINGDGSVSLQFRVGTLAMDQRYELDINPAFDNYIRGMRPGYCVSGVYTQAAPWDGITAKQPNVSIDGFMIYEGGMHGGAERWNALEVMLRNNQIWVWWNGLLIPPSAAASAALPSPVIVTTPYFPVQEPKAYGKFGVRLWPGALVRRSEVRSQPRFFNELIYGGLEIQ